MADSRHLKFSPTDELLVDYYLRQRVDTGREDFITEIKLYEDEPWLLPHVKNDQFKEKKWFYFVVRTRGSGNRPKRTVPGRGGSNGGTWTASGVKKEIRDRNKKLIGYKTELSYHKKVEGKIKGDTTRWCMTEYWLASKNDAEFQEVVLCHLRDNNKNVHGTVDVEQPAVEKRDDNNLTPGGEEEEATREYAEELENMLEEEDDKATQHPQITLPLQGQDSESVNYPLVIMEDDCVNQDGIFNLVDQEPGATQPQQQQQQQQPLIIL